MFSKENNKEEVTEKEKEESEESMFLSFQESPEEMQKI